MATPTERIIRAESDIDNLQQGLIDHETRLRRMERLTFGIIGAALIFSWIVTQADILNGLFINGA